MMDKASRFTDTMQVVVASNPELDENTRRPLATFAANQQNRIAQEAKQEVLASLSAEVGLLFFYRADCQYCHIQAPILSTFGREFGVAIKAVSLDGQPLAGSDFSADYTVDHGQAETLGVTSTPALYLIRPRTAEIKPISHGVLSFAEIGERVLLQARLAGWIHESVYASTQPVQPLDPFTGQVPIKDGELDIEGLIQVLAPSFGAFR